MRILVLWDVYDRYPSYFYRKHPDVAELPYSEQLDRILKDFFWWPPYLLPHFRAAGHEANIIFGNIRQLQLTWAREHNYSLDQTDWRYTTALEQIKRFNPDILFIVGAVDAYLGAFVKEAKKYCRRVVAWKAVAFADHLDWAGIDCILSSHTVFVDQFRGMGLRSERVLPCFEPAVLARLTPTVKTIEASFIGTLSPLFFNRRMELLNYVQGRVPLEIYAEKMIWRRRPWPLGMFLGQARSIPFLIRRRLRPAVYGLEMFQVLAASKIALNIHVDAANGLAGNIRMFEVTGVGTLLVTEAATNLSEIFEPEREVVTYRSPVEVVEKVRYYLDHPDERETIAAAAQRRTLREYNAARRAQDLLSVFVKL